MYHCPNEGKRSYAYALELQQLGMTAGVLDIHFFVANKTKAALWFEFKSESGRLTRPQKEFIERLEECNHEVHVVIDWEDARRIILDYIER